MQRAIAKLRFFGAQRLNGFVVHHATQEAPAFLVVLRNSGFG
jgi:hypothetical protein